MNQTENKRVIAGIDIGNGYVKANINSIVQVFPSVSVKQFNTGSYVKLGQDEIGTFMRDMLNQMDLSFASPLVQSTERRLFGDRAMMSGLNLEEFDVFSRTSKAEVDLSGVLVLATVAADRLTDYYVNNHVLPHNNLLQVRVDLATALPIGEYRKHSKEYRERFLNNGNPHIITIHNFEQLYRVEIIFDNVYIANEGESAQYGLMYAQEGFLEMIRAEAVKRFPNGELDDITGSDLVQAQNTLGIDIGEGTIDFAVFTGGRFNQDASSTMNQGYGAVLESTLSTLQAENHPYKNRKQLSEFIHSAPSPFTKRKWNHVKNVNQSEEARFAESVSSEVSKVFDRTGSFLEVIFVFGGGATPLEWTLFEQLQKRISEFGEDNLLPIVYLDSAYSRFLNVQGLYHVALRLRPSAKPQQSVNQ